MHSQGLLSAIVAAGALAGVIPPAAHATTSCSYEGPPSNTLTVRVTGQGIAAVSRAGTTITAAELLDSPAPCSGGTPTVLNTDAIRVLVGRGSSADVLLAGGPFAPGATPEGEGAPEIEIEIFGREVLTSVQGTSKADEFHWGSGGEHAGLNLNPGASGDRDVDVTVNGEYSFLVASGAGGDDTIVGATGADVKDGVFSDGGSGNDLLRVPRTTDGILDGGSGNDMLGGGGEGDLLEGGSGRDRLLGGGGDDNLDGGRGRDRLLGGAGRDRIDSRDNTRDSVGCGPGRDRVKADLRDRVRSCERVSRKRA